tara:strand:+ start:2590 stop:3228 length:639 start_codon:yes stop_codon:yes gene_type:complete
VGEVKDSLQVGVGPHSQPWPQGDQYDETLLSEGDSRNVLDKYRYWKVAAIKADLDASRVPLEVAIENLQHDFNIGTIVRSANAFNVSVVHIIGRRHWNRRGAMVTDAYMNIHHHKTVADFLDYARKDTKQIIAIDIVEESTPLSANILPERSILVFGGEGPGLSEELLAGADRIHHIEQLGSTRSVNVGVAAGIAMYQWVQQHSLVAPRRKK